MIASRSSIEIVGFAPVARAISTVSAIIAATIRRTGGSSAIVRRGRRG